MADDALRTTIDAISRRLRDELEERFRELDQRHQDELGTVRRAAEAETEQRWSTRVDEVRAEWTARLESEVSAARSESERRMVAESMRLRMEAEQAAAESEAKVRHEFEETLGRERDTAHAELTAERHRLSVERENVQRELNAAHEQLESLTRQLDDLKGMSARAESALQEERRARDTAHTELTAERHRLSVERENVQRELDTARQQLESLTRQLDDLKGISARAESALQDERRAREEDARQQERAAAAAAEARVAERQTQLAVVERVLTAIRSLDAARSLTQVLSSLLSSVAAEAPRVALFVANGADLKPWKAEGFGEGGASLQPGTDGGGLLAEVLRRGEAVATSPGAGPAPPAFAALAEDRAAIAVPLLVGAQPVAVLYADDGGEDQPTVPASWPEAIQILCRHASTNLAHLTAVRATEAMRRSLAPAAVGVPSSAAPDDNSARRYARLLVSEIKLYNEPAVRLGRQKRDLLTRLKPEIDRARRLYEQRVSTAVDSRGALFHQELVQTLADGDPALLGGPA